MADILELSSFRGALSAVSATRYDAFCAARRDFIAAAIAWIKTDDADPEIVALEIDGALNAIRALPACLGKGDVNA